MFSRKSKHYVRIFTAKCTGTKHFKFRVEFHWTRRIEPFCLTILFTRNEIIILKFFFSSMRFCNDSSRTLQKHEKEKQRLSKEIGKLVGEIKKIDSKLANKNFVERAPQEVIEEQRQRLHAETTLTKRSILKLHLS